MMETDLAFTPAWRLRQMIADKEVSPVELTELFLRRIEALNPKLNAYLTVATEEAQASARAAEAAVSRREALGPLHGIPVSVKDLLQTKGIRSTAGSQAFRDHVPQEESILVERVRAAGAIIIGKTNTPEFGLSGTTENRLGDACRNPWDPRRTSGGSSGGAGAAVAAGMGPLAIGSDGGGSIRIPSSFCGVYGIKPSQGRVPRHGGFGKSASNFFSQYGPMARNVRDAALLLQVLAGPDRRDSTCLREPAPDFLGNLEQGVAGLRVAWSTDLGYAPVEPEVVQVAGEAARAFDELGCRVEEPSLKVEDPFPAFWTIFSANAYAAYGDLMASHGVALTDYVGYTLEYGGRVKGHEYSQALRFIDELRAQMADLFEQFDLLLTPTMATTAFPVAGRPHVIGGREVDPLWGFLPFTFPFNMTGQPAASVPCGFSGAKLPVGLQIIGRRGEESTVLRASAAFEQARPWDSMRPPVS